jgi:hypothetical protein
MGAGLLWLGQWGSRFAEEQAARSAERKRQVSLATAEVRSITEQARKLLTEGNPQAARDILAKASLFPLATNGQTAAALSRSIQESEDPNSVRALLVGLPDSDFVAFEQGGVPRTLDFGFEVLTTRAVRIGREQLGAAKTEREQAKQREAELAEARRREEDARRSAEKAREEARGVAERAREEEAKREARQKLDSYMARLARVDSGLVRGVSVRRTGESWIATITVQNLWHLRHYQLRLQDAQALWEIWALVASPDAPDCARIKIVDLRDNEVGGSRLLGGSLIWVDDD